MVDWRRKKLYILSIAKIDRGGKFMKKIAPFFFSLVFVFLTLANHSYSETEPAIEEIETIETVDGSQELDEMDDIEKNVNSMLKLLEELESNQSLNEEGALSRPAENKTAGTDAFDGLVKPEEGTGVSGTQGQPELPQKRIEAANEVVRFVPEDPDSHFRLGLEYWRSQNFDQAINHFIEVIRLDPENAHAYWNLALLKDKKSNGSEAIAYLKKAEDIYTKYEYPSYAKDAQDRLQQYYEKYDLLPGSPAPSN